METNFYKLSRSLGKYQAFKTNEVEDKGFYAEINSDDETFSANIYCSGNLVDIGINRWTFSFHIEGVCSNVSNDFKINATDPQKKKTALINTPYFRVNNFIGREEFILCSFLDLVFLYCNFEDAEIANRFNLLLRSLEYDKSNPFRRYEDEKTITPEVALTQAKFFKDYYLKHHKGNYSDSNFMTTIKESVNKAVDIYKNEIESYKIND